MNTSNISNATDNVNTFFNRSSQKPTLTEKRVILYKTYLPNLANDFFLSGRQKRILRELFRHINQTLYVEQNDSIVWPGATRIAEQIGTHKSHVFRDIKILREEGYIAKTTFSDHKCKIRHKSVQPYCINLEKMEVKMPAKIYQFPTTEKSETAPHRAPHSAPHRAPHSDAPPYIYEEEEKQREKEEKQTPRARAKKPASEKDENKQLDKANLQDLHDEVIAYFNKLSGKRFRVSAELQKRIKDGYSREDLMLAVENSMGMMNDDFMQNYHEPNQIFQKSKIERYMNIKFKPGKKRQPTLEEALEMTRQSQLLREKK